jgi:LytS/YehU family sensor histidine kinase
VENAIRHGIDGLLGGGTIGINATRTGDQLHLCIENPVDAGALPKEGTGVGLDNVRRRIAGLYGTDGRITTLRDASRFTVRIDIPVRTPEEN